MATMKHPRFNLIRSLRVADYLTLGNAFCGVFSIFLSLQRFFVTAYVLILIGYELDIFDGRVARWRNECSMMGKELDSLSDLITFGMAPAIMSFSVGFSTPLDQIVLSFYVVSGLARLARFNVSGSHVPKKANGKSMYSEGLPIPKACLAVSTTVIFCVLTNRTSEILLAGAILPRTYLEFHPAIIMMVAVSCMMLSKRLRVSGGKIGIPTMKFPKMALAE